MTHPDRRAAIAAAKLLVVKVGSALVTADGRGLDHEAIRGWAAQIARLFDEGRRVCLVSSGAIAAGMQRLGWTQRPKETALLQAAAAVGQAALIDAYEHAFRPHGRHTAQILLTHADLADRTRYLNARGTLKTLLDLGVVPIINENDTIVTDEIKFGDNDTLGALVTNLIDADALFILTDQQGLYTADPRVHPEAELVREGNAEDPRYAAMAGGAGSAIAKGGMITKIRAAARAAKSGAHTVIASGREPDVIVRLAHGEALGTLLYAERSRLAARKQWLADHLKLAGRLYVDAGAARALRQGKSLLPVGVTRVEGEFVRGAVVACLDPEGREIGRGLINYGSTEVRAIMGMSSGDIIKQLGYMEEPELIHRDQFVLLD